MLWYVIALSRFVPEDNLNAAQAAVGPVLEEFSYIRKQYKE